MNDAVRILARAGLAVLALLGLGIAAQADTRLIMVEEPGCAYCAAWLDEIGPSYPNTVEGRFAPLLRADLRNGPPEGVSYARKVVYTPTFVLINDGNEIARLEGYPGENFFWPLLQEMLGTVPDYDPSGL